MTDAPDLPIARAALTSQLVAHLVTELEGTMLVGRGSAPQGGGWTGGQPNSGTYNPYVVVKTRLATPLQKDAIGRDRTSWQCQYVLTYSHVKDSAVDELADLGRAAMASFGTVDQLSLNGVMWSVQKVDMPRLGAVGPNYATNPPFQEVSDDVSLWVSRGRTP